MPESTQSAAQLTVKFGNAPDAPETIYLGEEPSVNKLTLSVEVSVEAKFTQAQPVLRSEAPKAKGSLLFLDLRKLQLSANELGRLKVAAKRWKSKIDPAGYVCLAPEEDLTQQAGVAIEFEIDDLSMSKPPQGSSVELSLILFRVEGVTTGDSGFPWNFRSLLMESPSGKANLHKAIALTVPEPPLVVCSTDEYANVENEFSFLLGPGDEPREIKAEKDTLFEIAFVYAPAGDPDGYGALCTAEQALNISVTAGQNATGWHITAPKDEQNPTWLLRPPKGKPIVSGQSTVQFLVEDVETKLRPGPTLMFVTYSGVTGYEDGAYVQVLEKVGHAAIESFEIAPNPAVLNSEGSAKVTLSWKAVDAVAMSVMGYGPVKGDSVELEVFETTHFTLQAEGRGGQRNSAIKTETAVVLPVINSFKADPEAVFQGDFPCEVELSWNVDTQGKVRLESSSGIVHSEEYEPQGAVGLEVEAPQTVTLIPKSGESDPLVRRSVVLSAFDPQLAPQALSQPPSCVAASPQAAFVVVGSGQATVTALDTMTYQPIGQPVATGQGPIAMAFSPDGAMLYVACAGGSAVSPIAVKATGDVPQFEFTNLGNFALGAEARGIAIAPSGKYVYVTTADGHLAVLQVQASGNLEALTTLAVGAQPAGVAVLSTGARVYVANAGDNSVTVVGVNEAGHHAVVRKIKDLPSEPAAVATTADSRVLLIACEGAGEVVARSVEFPGSIGNTLTAGAGACDLALVPGERYAVVANKGAGSVTLLGLGETPAACEVLSAGIEVGAGPVAVAVTPEAGLVFAATSGASSLAVLTLAEYAPETEPVAAGGQVTNVVVDAAETMAVIWHDALQRVMHGSASKGVCVYDLKSLETAPQLANQPIIDFVFDPTADASRGFAITTTNPLIEVVDTSAWKPNGEFDLSAAVKGAEPRVLAASADGSTLFALVGTTGHEFSLVALAVGKGGTLSPIGKAVTVFTAAGATLVDLAAAPDGSRAYVLDEAGEKLWVVARGEGQYALEGKPVALGEKSTALASSPDGSRLFVLGRPQTANTLTAIATSNLATKTLVLSSLQYSSLNGLAVGPDNSKVFVTDGEMAGIRILDATSLRLIQTISFAGDVENPLGIAVAPTGSRLFTANVNSNNLGVAQQVQATGRPSQLGGE